MGAWMRERLRRLRRAGAAMRPLPGVSAAANLPRARPAVQGLTELLAGLARRPAFSEGASFFGDPGYSFVAADEHQRPWVEVQGDSEDVEARREEAAPCTPQAGAAGAGAVPATHTPPRVVRGPGVVEGGEFYEEKLDPTAALEAEAGDGRGLAEEPGAGGDDEAAVARERLQANRAALGLREGDCFCDGQGCLLCGAWLDEAPCAACQGRGCPLCDEDYGWDPSGDSDDCNQDNGDERFGRRQ